MRNFKTMFKHLFTNHLTFCKFLWHCVHTPPTTIEPTPTDTTRTGKTFFNIMFIGLTRFRLCLRGIGMSHVNLTSVNWLIIFRFGAGPCDPAPVCPVSVQCESSSWYIVFPGHTSRTLATLPAGQLCYYCSYYIHYI